MKLKTVFISYKSEDYDKAKEIYTFLENHGLKCWISEQDLDRTANYWQDEIMCAISQSNVIVLILSKIAVNNSGQILNEVASASSQGKLIIPYIIENTPISAQLSYFINKYEWIEEFNLGKQKSLMLLADRLSVKQSTILTVQNTLVKNKLLENEATCFAGINGGSYGVGFDKCLVKIGNTGWSPHDVYIEEVDRNEFTFSSIGDSQRNTQYEAYCSTPEYHKMELRGNNRVRWMLKEIYQNDKLFLSLQQTRWSQLTFWWDQVRGNSELQRKLAMDTFGMQKAFYPNSLCLHLIIETADDKLICTKISSNKKNDYSFTIAVTIGEQIGEADFSSGETNNNHFIYDWCKRACIEEFGFTNQDYSIYVDESSIRVLALSYEGDIYNFALPTYLKLQITFEDLLTFMTNSPQNNDEFADIFAISLDETVDILERAGDPEMKKNYHPSSFLRMLLYVAYRDPDRIW